MNVLLTIPHVFAPKAGSLYSSQTEDKRSVKTAALKTATQENVNRTARATTSTPHWACTNLWSPASFRARWG